MGGGHRRGHGWSRSEGRFALVPLPFNVTWERMPAFVPESAGACERIHDMLREAFGLAKPARSRSSGTDCTDIAGFRFPCLGLAERLAAFLRICPPRNSYLSVTTGVFGSARGWWFLEQQP